MLLHIDTFRVPKITVHFIFSKFFETIFSVHFRPISNANILYFASPYTHISPTVFFGCLPFFQKYLTEKNGCFLTNIKSSISLILIIYCPPYTHISCSVYTVHFKIGKNFVSYIRYILDLYQMLTFFDSQNICFSIYAHFVYWKSSTFENLIFFCTKYPVHF